MGNPYAQRVAPPALKRKASPPKVGRAAVAERELQAHMETIARQNAELAQRQAQLAEEQEAMRLAAEKREERERQRAQEAAERSEETTSEEAAEASLFLKRVMKLDQLRQDKRNRMKEVELQMAMLLLLCRLGRGLLVLCNPESRTRQPGRRMRCDHLQRGVS